MCDKCTGIDNWNVQQNTVSGHINWHACMHAHIHKCRHRYTRINRERDLLYACNMYVCVPSHLHVACCIMIYLKSKKAFVCIWIYIYICIIHISLQYLYYDHNVLHRLCIDMFMPRKRVHKSRSFVWRELRKKCCKAHLWDEGKNLLLSLIVLVPVLTWWSLKHHTSLRIHGSSEKVT